MLKIISLDFSVSGSCRGKLRIFLWIVVLCKCKLYNLRDTSGMFLDIYYWHCGEPGDDYGRII